MSEMVERVLMAIREAAVFSETSGGVSIANAEEVARAAIGAMREPTNEMLQAFYGDTPTEDWLGEDWKDMIDAALK